MAPCHDTNERRLTNEINYTHSLRHRFDWEPALTRHGSSNISRRDHIHLPPNIDSADRERKDTGRVQVLTGLFGRCLARIESFIYFSLDLLQFTCSSTRSSLGTIGSGISAFVSSLLCLAICDIPCLASTCFLDWEGSFGEGGGWLVASGIGRSSFHGVHLLARFRAGGKGSLITRDWNHRGLSVRGRLATKSISITK